MPVDKRKLFDDRLVLSLLSVFMKSKAIHGRPGRGRLLRLLCALFASILLSVWFCGCGSRHSAQAERLNDLSYYYHYRSLDSAENYARQALRYAEGDDSGTAEALNHLAFVAIMRMDYPLAKRLCDSIDALTDNQIELLVSDIQRMRVCQRESRNKAFYDCYQRAGLRLRRITEADDELSPRQRRRMLYARSEYHIVSSAYFYYVGLERQSIFAISKLRQETSLASDTAQMVNYLYSLGAGGVVTKGSSADISQREFDYLMRAYRLAVQSHSTFWIANTLQSLSEHLLQRPEGARLMADNPRDIKLLNADQMPDSLLAGNLAERSLRLFRQYGDVYQKAGSLRTLANCYWQIADYPSALLCLQQALDEDTVINRAPDLVASIREQLCLVYSAVDDKQASDYNRNLYLDLQDQTRQDRYYEARAEQLDRTSHTLNLMLAAVAIMILLVVGLLVLFVYLRSRGGSADTLSPLLNSLEQWRKQNEARRQELDEQCEENEERMAVATLHVQTSKKRNLEQRATVALVNSVMPLIDRMLLEIRHLVVGNEPEERRTERYTYLTELTRQVNTTNAMLTEWIQLRQGKLSVRVESLPLQPLFDLVAKGKADFRLKGVQLIVEPTALWVKADRVLTLFMVNTLAENARKFTSQGGTVTVSARDAKEYVEVSVSDTGCGMSADQQAHLFEYKPVSDETLTGRTTPGGQRSHGFGLMNCKGIINQYRKLSQLFAVCTLQAESRLGEGSRFFFRLPKGVVRKSLVFGAFVALSLGCGAAPLSKPQRQLLRQATLYADSAYQSNIDGHYAQTLVYADSCRAALNRFYLALRPHGEALMAGIGNEKVESPEVQWLHDGLPTNYNVILSVRNESAVAALALHEWDTYQYNNKVYTQLFKEMSADNTLPRYCAMMQRSEANKHVAVVLLLLLLLSIAPAFYFIYYRHRINFLLCADQVRQLADTLLSSAPLAQKLQAVERVAATRLPSQLRQIVEQMRQALAEAANMERVAGERIQAQRETLGRLELEDERLHVSNSTLDNSLSTLKHETMYYPSRVAMLLETGDAPLADVQELTAYYRDLYQLLCLQAMSQLALVPLTGGPVRLADLLPASATVLPWQGEEPTDPQGDRIVGDRDLLRYLFELLQQANGGHPLRLAVGRRGDDYLVLRVALPGAATDEAACHALFTPSARHIPYMLCSQIVRDNGELTNRRGCGIVARWEDNITYLIITIARWKNSK